MYIIVLRDDIMKSRKTAKKIICIIIILLLAVGLFVGGVNLADRYQNTIVSTYNKYYTKYYDKAMSYIDRAYTEIKDKIEMASQQDKKDLHN